MKITRCAFAYSMAKAKDYRQEEKPEIAIVGKSNVGKSSLINCVLGNSKLARTSQQPGKTRLVNFFDVNGQFYLVDLPGYGYAKIAKSQKEQWGSMFESYFQASKQLKRMLFLLDIRHAPTELDAVMLEWLRYYQIPYTVVATKCDKIAKSKLPQYFRVIREKLGLSSDDKPIYFSAVQKKGKEEVLQIFEEICKEEDAVKQTQNEAGTSPMIEEAETLARVK